MDIETQNAYRKSLEEIREEYRKIYSGRKGALVFDGIVDENHYQNILFLLKEANQEDSISEEPKPLNELLRDNEPWELWLRVAEWVWGISNTTPNKQLPYTSLEYMSRSDLHNEIKKIAVININKADGIGSPKQEEIKKRLQRAIDTHPDLLREEIEAVSPRIIICGNTYSYLRKLYRLPKSDGYKGFCKADIGLNKDVLILDVCHPNAHVMSLMAYYGVVGIYQQALLDGWER